jgi:hypothetical protein
VEGRASKPIKRLMPTSKTTKLFSSLAVVLISTITVVCLLVKWWDDLAVLASVFGAVAGWATGTLASPYESEERRFKIFSKVLTAFLTGFLLSKVDRGFEIAVDEKHRSLLFDSAIVRRTLIGMTCFILAMMAVYISRKYYHVETPGQALPSNPSAHKSLE